MWEAFVAFHIRIARFLFSILGNIWVSPRIPERRKLMMLFDCLQVSVRTPSTTLGGMECHIVAQMIASQGIGNRGQNEV